MSEENFNDAGNQSLLKKRVDELEDKIAILMQTTRELSDRKEIATKEEHVFDKLNKIIGSWFSLLKKTTWAITVFLALFAFIGILFFGYNASQMHKDYKSQLEEFNIKKKDLDKKLNELKIEIDSKTDKIREEAHENIDDISDFYNSKFRTIRRELNTKTRINLPEDFETRYTPSIKP